MLTLYAQDNQAQIEEELTFEELVVLRTIAQAKAESEISQVGLWCKKIANSYLDLDSDLEHFYCIGEVWLQFKCSVALRKAVGVSPLEIVYVPGGSFSELFQNN